MNPFDWSTPTEAEHAPDRGRRPIARPSQRRREQRRRRNRNAIALLGAASLGVLIYVAGGRIREGGSGEITSPLPHAKPAAVINLPPPNLLRPLSSEEAAKENAERPFVNRPDTAAGRFVLRTDASDADRALTCLTQAVYYEAASEGVDGGRAVAQVVLNRMRHPGYPASVCGVVFQGADRTTGCQFTFTCDGSLLRAPVPALWNRSRKIAQDALAGRVFAAIGHATHYHADYVLPYWADSLDKTVQIGRHIFYRLRSSLGDGRAFSQRYAGKEPPPPAPASPTVIPPQEVSQELAKALLSDATVGLSKDVEKAAAAPGSALLIDSSKGTLLTDTDVSAPAPKKARSKAECPTNSDGKKLVPLGADDIHSGASPAAC